MTVESLTVATPQISPRMRDALVADRAMEDLSAEGNGWMRDRPRQPEEWTENLARQLGIDFYYDGVHETLLLVVEQLDALIREWPPSSDQDVCLDIARQATKNLTPIELYTTLLAGPGRWRKTKLSSETSYDQLPARMKSDLERALAGELSRMLAQWKSWEIPKLHRKRDQAIAEARAKERNQPSNDGARVRRPPDRQAISDLRRGGYYTPPGRT